MSIYLSIDRLIDLSVSICFFLSASFIIFCMCLVVSNYHETDTSPCLTFTFLNAIIIIELINVPTKIFLIPHPTFHTSHKKYSPPLFPQINMVINAVVKSLLDDSYKLSLGLKPLPMEGELELKLQMYQNHRVGFLIGMFVGVGFAMYTSSVVHFLLWERQVDQKPLFSECIISLESQNYVQNI